MNVTEICLFRNRYWVEPPSAVLSTKLLNFVLKWILNILSKWSGKNWIIYYIYSAAADEFNCS